MKNIDYKRSRKKKEKKLKKKGQKKEKYLFHSMSETNKWAHTTHKMWRKKQKTHSKTHGKYLEKNRRIKALIHIQI